MRTIYSLRNMATGFAGQILKFLIGFISRTVFIYCLSEEYLGINGLFGSVLTVLCLADLGIGSCIIYALYKPIADSNTEKIKSLMDFYRRAFRVIGTVFLIVGAALTPVLPYLAKGGTDLVNLKVIYLMMVLEMTSSYWFFAYKGAILEADQKGYVISIISFLISLLNSVLRIVLLLLLRSDPRLSFYVYSAVGITTNILSNYLVKRQVDRMYPYLRDENITPLTKEEKAPILRNVAGMAANRICRVLNDGIDSTVISALIGVARTGVFSNYLMLRTSVDTILRTIFGSMHSSIGNFCAVETRERKEEFLRTLHFIYFWVYGFCSISLWIMFRPFIAGVWLHDAKWLLAPWEEFLLAFNFLIEGLAGAVVKYRDVHGLFWQTRYRYIFSSVLNAALSIVLVGPAGLGVGGALLGTTVSLIVMLSFDPSLVYREAFGKKAWEFYRMYFRDLALVMATGALVKLATLPFSTPSWGSFFACGVLCAVIPNGLWYLLFRRSPQFLYMKNKAAGLLRHFAKKKKA